HSVDAVIRATPGNRSRTEWLVKTYSGVCDSRWPTALARPTGLRKGCWHERSDRHVPSLPPADRRPRRADRRGTVAHRTHARDAERLRRDRPRAGPGRGTAHAARPVRPSGTRPHRGGGLTRGEPGRRPEEACDWKTATEGWSTG